MKCLLSTPGLALFGNELNWLDQLKKSIEVEYFIYGLDDTSKAFSTELVKAEARGVKVRVLIDKSVAVFVLDEYYAKAMVEKGIQIKYYNVPLF